MLRTIGCMTASGAGSRSRPPLLALAVLAVALGILGMHGLGAHGVTSGVVAPAAVTVPASDHGVEDASGMSGGHAGHRSSPTQHSPAEHSPVGHEDDTHGTLMWCVAMLAAAAVALIVARVARTRHTRPWAVLAPAPLPRLPRRFVLRVGTGPPSVWSFSVIRC